MGYYMGDYRGDFYMAGDLFSIVRRGASAIKGALVHTPAAAGMAQKVGSAIQRVRGALAPAASRVVGAAARHPVLSAAAAAGTTGVVGAALAHHAALAAPHMAGGAGMRGFHLSRRSGRMVRNRRMRVTNVKALRRSIRRCQGFARLAKRVLSFTSPRGHKGRPYFKKTRRKK